MRERPARMLETPIFRKEHALNGEELSKILCLLEPGMSLTAPDEWVDRVITGTRAQQMSRIGKLSRDYGCIWRQGDGAQTFEKLEVPATG